LIFAFTTGFRQCPKCGSCLQPDPLKKILPDRTLSELVTKILPSLREEDRVQEELFYKSIGIKRKRDEKRESSASTKNEDEAMSHKKKKTDTIETKETVKKHTDADDTIGTTDTDNKTESFETDRKTRSTTTTAAAAGDMTQTRSSSSYTSNSSSHNVNNNSNNDSSRPGTRSRNNNFNTPSPALHQNSASTPAPTPAMNDEIVVNLKPQIEGLKTTTPFLLLDKPILRTSGQLKVLQLKKYILKRAKKKKSESLAPQQASSTSGAASKLIEISCNGDPLGDELSLTFVHRTRWLNNSSQDLTLHYRYKREGEEARI